MRRIYQEKGIRRYGFHGTSYKYLTAQAAKLLGKPESQVNLIICHLGAGSSMCAVKGGISIDTTMGVTPLEGLVMASRSGDIDPAVPLMLMDMYKMKPKEVDSLLNKSSGLLGMSGMKDMRAILEAVDKGNPQAQAAFDVFVYRVRKYLGSYYLALNGAVDAIVFSAGIGENAWRVRQPICESLEGLGIRIDAERCVAGTPGGSPTWVRKTPLARAQEQGGGGRCHGRHCGRRQQDQDPRHPHGRGALHRPADDRCHQVITPSFSTLPPRLCFGMLPSTRRPYPKGFLAPSSVPSHKQIFKIMLLIFCEIEGLFQPWGSRIRR